jgi:S-layer family protein
MKRCQAALRAAAMIVACAVLGARLARAQEEVVERQAAREPGAPRLDTYGTGATTNYVLQAFAFDPDAGGGSNVGANSFGSRYCSSSCALRAPVMLPAGAVLVGMELEACDTDAAGQVTAQIARQPRLEGPFVNLASVGTGVSTTPGCGFFNSVMLETIDNETSTYYVRLNVFGTTAATRFQAVRLVYRLQVSPAPATATFPNDVPTSHPFFRFVEALAAAGITGGCSAGSFCPNEPVTRGQMAVFLATALGLHFPN